MYERVSEMPEDAPDSLAAKQLAAFSRENTRFLAWIFRPCRQFKTQQRLITPGGMCACARLLLWGASTYGDWDFAFCCFSRRFGGGIAAKRLIVVGVPFIEGSPIYLLGARISSQNRLKSDAHLVIVNFAAVFVFLKYQGGVKLRE